jgi:uroporphyrinogen decarboxylase
MELMKQQENHAVLKSRFLDALDCRVTDRVPFVPAIYEHKGWFVGATPSQVSRDLELLTQAVLTEYDQVRADALVVGVDVYNVEAEAVGSEVTYFDDTSIPAIAHDGAVLKENTPIQSLKVPHPRKAGRMPLHIEAAKKIVRKIGRFASVRGALSGPFSLAANIVGPVNLFMMTLTDPQRVHDLLRFAVRVGQVYGKAFVEAGCGVIIFDSQSSPDLLSPAMYREFVLGPTKDLIGSFRALGLRHVPLIIGGNTTSILDSYIDTGANNIVCDATADAATFLAECSKHGRAFRRNIDTSDFLTVRTDDVHETALRILEEGRGYPGFILGTGVVPYGTPLECLQTVRTAVEYFTK